MTKFFELAPIRYKESLDPYNFIKKMNWISTNYVIWPIQEAIKLGFETKIILHSNTRKKINYKGIIFESFKTLKIRDMLFSPQIVKYVLKEKPDFIYLHNGMWTNWAILKLVNKSKKIIMPHYIPHSTFSGKFFFNFFEKKMFNYADIVIVLSEWEKNIFSNFVDEKKIRVLPHPIDLSKIKIKNDEKKNNEIIITSVCAIIRSKGLHFLAKIWNKLEKKYKIKWLIAGQILDKNYYNELLYLTKNSKNVIFLGYKNKKEIEEILSKTDIFVHTSYGECFGLSMLEAQAHGIPVISTNSRAIPYIISPKNYLIQLGNIKQLENYLSVLIENEKLRKEIGKYNIEFVKKFDYENIRKNFIKIIDELNES
ncbi:MAG: glycosyltransferase family 4 protein [Candidatus Aenigmatarchaeota archaeon]